MSQQILLQSPHSINSQDSSTVVFKSATAKYMFWGFMLQPVLWVFNIYHDWQRGNLPSAALSVFVTFPTVVFALRDNSSKRIDGLAISPAEIDLTHYGVRYRMEWSEVAKVETDQKGNRLIFCSIGDTKRIAVAPKQFPALEEWLTKELEKRRIPFETTKRAVYIDTKNTQVR